MDPSRQVAFSPAWVKISGPRAPPSFLFEVYSRTTAAFPHLLTYFSSSVDFGVGLEGGLQEIDGEWFDCEWVVVVDKNGVEGIGPTMRLQTSVKMMKLIKRGKELGDVNDILFKRKNSKQAEGYFGLMTNGAITRTQGYRDGIIAVSVRFLHSEVF